jgi:hypothetical protein
LIAIFHFSPYTRLIQVKLGLGGYIGINEFIDVGIGMGVDHCCIRKVHLPDFCEVRFEGEVILLI